MEGPGGRRGRGQCVDIGHRLAVSSLLEGHRKQRERKLFPSCSLLFSQRESEQGAGETRCALS